MPAKAGLCSRKAQKAICELQPANVSINQFGKGVGYAVRPETWSIHLCPSSRFKSWNIGGKGAACIAHC
jgi:hypothetical protein